MVAVFLRGELDSERFAPGIGRALRTAGAQDELITAPDLASAADNALRRRILDETRGYDRRVGLFDGFPNDVRWERVTLTASEVASVLYIDWSYWLELSGGSRRPADAAARIRAGFEAFGVKNDGFHELAAEFRERRAWSELILVSARAEGGDVVLEGHARLTAMALAADAVPRETEMIRGVSPRMVECSEY